MARIIPDTEKLMAAFNAFLMLERGSADNSRSAYLADARRLVEYLPGGTASLEHCTVETLQEFLASLHDLGLNPRSTARILSGIRALFRYLTVEGYVESNPALLLEPPHLGLHLPSVLSVEEIDAMIAAIDPDSREALRDRALMETLYGCGLRVSELINLEIGRLALDEGFLGVRGKGNKERLVPLGEVTADAIATWMAQRAGGKMAPGEENYLFLSPRTGRRITRVRVFNIIRTLAARAGISREVSPHTLRHSFASHLLDGGANLRAIQQMLGHESLTTTEIYIHLDNAHLRSQILDHHPRNRRHTFGDGPDFH